MCKVTLDEWAHDHFRTPPSSNTLRRWAREGLISPAPVKHGRSYYVEADACYREPDPLPKIPAGSSLVTRIVSARYGAQAA